MCMYTQKKSARKFKQTKSKRKQKTLLNASNKIKKAFLNALAQQKQNKNILTLYPTKKQTIKQQ